MEGHTPRAAFGWSGAFDIVAALGALGALAALAALGARCAGLIRSAAVVRGLLLDP